MKIKSISCEQFAGVRNRSVDLTDGINVIYGKNESGKSTLVNLLSRTLFQKAKLDLRRDKDKNFVESYFPSANKDGSITGDFVDGKITIESEKGVYTLSKEWGDDPRCTLSTPDGVVREQRKIDESLKDILLYGEGVYSDMLFSSQSNTISSLQKILDSSKKTDAKKEITDTVSQAFAESDGVSIDDIEQAINNKIKEIAGEYWDFEREAPKRKQGGGRWGKGLKEILKAYYALEDAKAVLEEISRLEAEADRAASDYKEKDTAARDAEEAYRQFNIYASRLIGLKAIDRLKEDLRKIDDVLQRWPKAAEDLKKARDLESEKKSRDLIDTYEDAKKNHDELKKYTDIENLACPSDAEITQVRNAQRDVAKLENKLRGMNLNAAINMLNGNRVEITSLRTGEPVEISDGAASIAEAVRITVPGVMEMQLSPANVDVAEVERQIEKHEKLIAGIFAKYEVDSLDKLENLKNTIDDAKGNADLARRHLAMILGGKTYEEVEAEVEAITDVIRPREDIVSEIIGFCVNDDAVCGDADISKFVIKKENIIEGYERDYGSIDNLEVERSNLKDDLGKAEKSVSGIEDIPEKYSSVSEPKKYLEELQLNLEQKRNDRDAAYKSKAEAESKLERYQEAYQEEVSRDPVEDKKRSGDPVEDLKRAKRDFEEQKTLLAHWVHIQEVFNAQKENMQNNPMQDIADSFARYLGVISGGKVSSEFPEADKLNMNIYSENRLLDYGKLSEGTKDTVSLAFRLAVLDHLFPDGGGVVVFDDPFTDMDADRMTQSCELIKECAKRHQVIFLTCREEYLDALKGNSIRF